MYKHGFEIIREVDSLLTSQNFNVFVENSNISRDHEIFKYRYYIYDDFKGKIRHSLGYNYTPAFIILDIEHKIIDVIFMNQSESKEKNKLDKKPSAKQRITIIFL